MRCTIESICAAQIRRSERIVGCARGKFSASVIDNFFWTPTFEVHQANDSGCNNRDMSNTSRAVLPQIAQDCLDRLEARTAKIGVIGLGYVGLPLSLLLSEAGFKVTGFDIDARKGTHGDAGLGVL